MLFDIAGHEYFAAAHDAVTLVGGANIIAAEIHSNISLLDYLALFSHLIGVFSVIGAMLAVISSTYENNTLKTYFQCLLYSAYSFFLPFAILAGFVLIGSIHRVLGIVYFALVFCTFWFVKGSLKLRFLSLDSRRAFFIIYAFFCYLFVLSLTFYTPFSFVVVAIFPTVPILLALYYKRFRERDIPMRPLLMFMGAAYALFILPLALEYFGVIS